MERKRHGQARTIYMPDELWTTLVSVSNELRVSVSSLIARFCLKGIEEGIPREEFERLQKIGRIDENIQEIAKLTRWGNELRKSGAYARKTLVELLKGESDKKRVPLSSLCSKEELEAYKRLFQHRQKLAEDTVKLVLDVYPDLGTFHIGIDDKGRWKVYYGKEVTPNTIVASFMNTIDVCSQTPFEDWIKKQRNMLYDFSMFNGVADFYNQIENKAKSKSEKATSTAT